MERRRFLFRAKREKGSSEWNEEGSYFERREKKVLGPAKSGRKVLILLTEKHFFGRLAEVAKPIVYQVQSL